MKVYQKGWEFSADDSIFDKLSWINKSAWVSIMNLNSMVDQHKIALQQLPEFGVANVESVFEHFQVIILFSDFFISREHCI